MQTKDKCFALQRLPILLKILLIAKNAIVPAIIPTGIPAKSEGQMIWLRSAVTRTQTAKPDRSAANKLTRMTFRFMIPE